MATSCHGWFILCHTLLACLIVHAAAYPQPRAQSSLAALDARAILQPGMPQLLRSEQNSPASVSDPPAAEATGAASATLPRSSVANEPLALVLRPMSSPSTASAPATTEDTSVYDQASEDGLPSWAYAIIFIGTLACCWKLNTVSRAIYEWATGKAEGEKTVASDLGGDPPDTVPDQVEMPESLYGVVIGCIMWDTYAIEKTFATWQIRRARMAVVMLLHVFGLALQVGLLIVIVYFGSAKAVYDVRMYYSQFERVMYGTNVYLDEYGFYRGKDKQYFIEASFDSIDEDLKSNVCRIPFTQPHIVIMMLFLWSLCVLGDVKDTLLLIERLVWKTGRCEQIMENENEESDQGSLTISKLPLFLKIFLGYGILFPRLAMDGCLLWIGCRWLAATLDFGDLVLNAVGLEFVLLLPEITYKTIVSDLNKRDAQRISIDTTHEKTVPTMQGFFQTIIWGAMALLWAVAYVYHIQMVLPHYRWDVRGVCTNWMKVSYQ